MIAGVGGNTGGPLIELDGAALVPIHNDLRLFCPSTISSQTAVTYCGVAPCLTSCSGVTPSCRRFRIRLMYCLASSGEISGRRQRRAMTISGWDLLAGAAAT